jgi:3-oxoacyl-[acyl-carrier protein] reductase
VAAGWHHQAPVRTHDDLLAVPWDVTSAGSIESGVECVLARWGQLDVLVNNAGLTADGPVAGMADDDWDRVLEVNLKGAFRSARAVVPVMVRRRQGHIVNISSFAARRGHAGQANYVAAKAGLIGLTESLAKELGGRGICVNAVLPGILPTRMTAGLSEEQLAGLAAENALRRLNSADEVARFVVFLVGMKNASGQVFQLDSRIGRWT